MVHKCTHAYFPAKWLVGSETMSFDYFELRDISCNSASQFLTISILTAASNEIGVRILNEFQRGSFICFSHMGEKKHSQTHTKASECMYVTLTQPTHNCLVVFATSGNLLPCNLSSFEAQTHKHTHSHTRLIQ